MWLMIRQNHRWQAVSIAFAGDTLAMLRFFTRLPVPALSFERDIHAMPDFTTAVRALPLAGAIIGCGGAMVVVFANGLGLPHQLVAALALSAIVLITGAMHEDGLADVADGFGGGGTIARKLEIMKDSRLGTYGVMALVLVTLARWSIISALLDDYGAGVTALALVAGSAVSRAACVMPMWLLPPARLDGAGYAAARPTDAAMKVSAALAAGIAIILPGFGPAGLRRVIAGLIFAALAGVGITELARRHIGGQTGDVAGAAQQISELAYLTGLLLWSDI